MKAKLKPRASVFDLYHSLLIVIALTTSVAGFVGLATAALAAAPCVPKKWCAKLKHSTKTGLAGKPHRVQEVWPAKKDNEFCKRGSTFKGPSCKYTYKIIMERPGKDITNGSQGRLPVYVGGAPWPGHFYVFDYEVSTVGPGNYLNPGIKVAVTKESHSSSGKVVLQLTSGLEPGTYYIRVALNVVYTVGAIPFSLTRILKWLISIPRSLSPVPDKKEMLARLAIQAFRADRNKNADVFKLIVPAKMPLIKGLKKKNADDLLKARNLKPNPNPKTTNDPKLHRIVKKQDKPQGNLRLADTLVAYQYWVYQGDTPSPSIQRASRCSRLGPADTECNSGFDEAYDPTTKCVKCPNKNVWILVPK